VQAGGYAFHNLPFFLKRSGGNIQLQGANANNHKNLQFTIYDYLVLSGINF
jgi:hypothetical protein